MPLPAPRPRLATLDGLALAHREPMLITHPRRRPSRPVDYRQGLTADQRIALETWMRLQIKGAPPIVSAQPTRLMIAVERMTRALPVQRWTRA